ncbi:MAG: peptide chain release factor N(5)-glutamine methyltransferase [Candidatus Eremiobacteraeota bacterium]|nr:peptide chain release factor N(5)-glutamine methyltransferase [Candidatus Eremiobacteraeota bacterium]MBC5828220.1 peptide chain release factor N(5)-glutamine methyltransferase [Candidatus Eremiobacteraeota bacterium]
MQSPEPTIAAAVEDCRKLLADRSQTPWLDARLLTSHVTGLDASAVIAYGDSILRHDLRRKLYDLVERRASGEPVAHLVGCKEFYGLRLRVDADVLVPRPETECLVAAVIDDWRTQAPRVLDLGTGSGAIACALAHSLPNARVLATDVSIAALSVARRNVEALGLCDRVTLEAGDLFSAVPPGSTFDAIVANLPYVGDDDAHALDDGVRAYEPHVALFAGGDGLDIYRRMFGDAPRRVRPGGALYCECGPFNARSLVSIARSAFPQAAVALHTDYAGLERIVAVRLPQAGSSDVEGRPL